MSGWRSIELRVPAPGPTRRAGALAIGVAATFALGACSGGPRQDVSEPKRNFTVEIPTATFPSTQQLSQHTQMTIVVRNVSTKTIPNVAVTVCNISCAFPAPTNGGTSVQAFAENLSQPGIANPSRPVWIVDRPPGPCGYSCNSGGLGGAVTAYSNTWALGALRPGDTAKFQWGVTAVKPGKHVVAWQVAAGLNGKSKAFLADGSRPQGTFTVTVQQAPQQSYVTDSGQIKVIGGSGH